MLGTYFAACAGIACPHERPLLNGSASQDGDSRRVCYGLRAASGEVVVRGVGRHSAPSTSGDVEVLQDSFRSLAAFKDGGHNKI